MRCSRFLRLVPVVASLALFAGSAVAHPSCGIVVDKARREHSSPADPLSAAPGPGLGRRSDQERNYCPD
jgi:hypothetical protein